MPSPADGCVAISASQLGFMLDWIDWRTPRPAHVAQDLTGGPAQFSSVGYSSTSGCHRRSLRLQHSIGQRIGEFGHAPYPERTSASLGARHTGRLPSIMLPPGSDLPP